MSSLLLQVKKHFKNIGVAADDKYIDPTYMICACLASASVSILCAALGAKCGMLSSLFRILITGSLLDE